jgi:hypothetical protein
MHDQYTVTSSESRQYVRTVIAANRRDAKHAHHEHYPQMTTSPLATPFTAAAAAPIDARVHARTSTLPGLSLNPWIGDSDEGDPGW